MKFFDHKDLGNHLPQLCPKVVKHPVYAIIKYKDYIHRGRRAGIAEEAFLKYAV
jgi:hypothetical protein